MAKLLYGVLLLGLATASFAIRVGDVPEMDGAGAVAAIALLGGIVALAVEKRRKQRSKSR